MTSIVPFFTIGLGCAGIVRRTLTPTSWFSPEFVTPTSKDRSVEIVIFVSVLVESWTPAGCDLGVGERAAVRAGRRAARRGAVDALPDRAHRPGGVEIRVLDEDGCRRRHSFDALCRHRRRSDSLEEVAPDDVARLEPLPLSREVPARRRRVLGVLRRPERVEEPLQPRDAEVERLDACSCAGVSGPGASMSRARCTSSSCCWRSPPSSCLQLGLLQPGGRQERWRGPRRSSPSRCRPRRSRPM